MSFFNHITREAPDPIVKIMGAHAQDTFPDKIDVTIGVYKTEEGDSSYVFPSVRHGKQLLAENDPGHCYTVMSGIPEFIKGARNIIFGEKFGQANNIASLQTISGTGSLHMALEFLKLAGFNNYHLGIPTWSNYEPMIRHSDPDCKINYYSHVDSETNDIDFDALKKAMNEAFAKSVFILQACCHNPTGTDFSKDQWREISSLAKKNDLFLVLDSAYLGFGSGTIEEDAWGIRHVYEQGLEFIVCQSYSKNMALYSERVGATHIVVQDPELTPNVQSQLTALFRHECSFAPAFGARVAAHVMNTPSLTKQWHQDIEHVCSRLKILRNKIHARLVELQTPGNWDHVVKQKGLFWYPGLKEHQIKALIEQYHVYTSGNGRVNVAGLNDSNIEYFCSAIDNAARL